MAAARDALAAQRYALHHPYSMEDVEVLQEPSFGVNSLKEFIYTTYRRARFEYNEHGVWGQVQKDGKPWPAFDAVCDADIARLKSGVNITTVASLYKRYKTVKAISPDDEDAFTEWLMTMAKLSSVGAGRITARLEAPNAWVFE